MNMKYFVILIFSHGVFGSAARGVKMGVPESSLVTHLRNSNAQPKSDINNWFEQTPAFRDHLKRFSKASIPEGKELLWASFAARQSISEDEDMGLRPLLSFQSNDSQEQQEIRYAQYLQVCGFRTEKFYMAYLAEQAKLKQAKPR